MAVGGAIFAALGALHGVLTLRDLSKPTAFTPTDPAVREAMRGARLALSRRAGLWDAWLGFNLSHSLGLLVFGSATLALGLRHSDRFAGGVQAAVLLVAAAYFVLALRFWFWGPALASGSALLCLLAGALLG